MSKPAVAPRPMGGFNQGFGDSNEHLDERAMETAVKQQALSHEASASGPGPEPKTPSAVGTLQEELVTRPAQDIKKELAAFFDINALLGINPTQDLPETQARKQAIHHRWEQLSETQKQVAEQQYHQELERKKQEQEAEEQKRLQEQRAAQASLVVPSGPQKGPIGPASVLSHKASTIQKLHHERQTLGGPASAN